MRTTVRNVSDSDRPMMPKCSSFWSSPPKSTIGEMLFLQ